jgi:hypothetical protein
MQPIRLDCKVSHELSEYEHSIGSDWPADFVLVARNGEATFRLRIGHYLRRAADWQKITVNRGKLLKERLPDRVTLELHVIDGRVNVFLPRVELERIAARLVDTEES